MYKFQDMNVLCHKSCQFSEITGHFDFFPPKQPFSTTVQSKQIFFKAAKRCQFGHFSQLYERKQSLESDCDWEMMVIFVVP